MRDRNKKSIHLASAIAVVLAGIGAPAVVGMDCNEGIRIVARGHGGREQVDRDPGVLELLLHARGDFQVDRGLGELLPLPAGVTAESVLFVGHLRDLPVSRLDPHAPRLRDAPNPNGRHGGEVLRRGTSSHDQEPDHGQDEHPSPERALHGGKIRKQGPRRPLLTAFAAASLYRGCKRSRRLMSMVKRWWEAMRYSQVRNAESPPNVERWVTALISTSCVASSASSRLPVMRMARK